MNHRFQRTELLLGPEGMARLRTVHVTVVGLGAVGSYALEALVRMGIGAVRIVDFDVIRESNFNRQLLAVSTNLGRLKVEAAQERILAINPDCHVEALACFVSGETLPSLLARPTDMVVDAIDGLNPKCNLLAELFRLKIPVVSCMGAARKRDPFAIRSGDISEVTCCPLGRRIRKRLKKVGIEEGIRCVYSTEPAHPKTLAEPDINEDLARGRTRIPMGSVSYITGMVGLVAAHEVCTMLLDRVP